MKLNMDKRMTASGVFVIALALLSYWFLHLFFSHALSQHEQNFLSRKVALADANHLLAQKSAYQSEWENAKSLLGAVTPDQDQMLNSWLKDILAYGSEEGITFGKLEPLGIKRELEQEEMRIYLEFEGDIRKLTRFIYHLLERDTRSRISSFSLRKSDTDKNFSYELILGQPFI